jgi:hypothetical protein
VLAMLERFLTDRSTAISVIETGRRTGRAPTEML